MSESQRLAEKLQAMDWCLGVRPIDKTSVPVIKVSASPCRTFQAQIGACFSISVSAQMEADVFMLDERYPLAVAMGLHARLGANSPLSQLDGDSLAVLRGQLGWSPACCEGGAAHHCADSGAAGHRDRVSPLALAADGESTRRRIAVDITFYSSQIKKNLLQHHGVSWPVLV
jgi:hypothetical protein